MSVQSIERPREPRQLGIAFITALLLHLLAVAAVAFWPQSAEDSPGEQEITIDVAPAIEEVPSVAPAEVSAVDAPLFEPQEAPVEPDTAEPLPPEEVTAEQSVDVAEASEPETALESSEPEDVAEVPSAEAAMEPEPVVAVPPPETVVAKPLEVRPPPKKPVTKPVEKPVERKPPPRRAVAQPQQPPSEARQGQASSSRENTQGAAASADPNVLKSYGARVRATLQSRFRIPDALRSQGFNGSATVSFTVDDSGRIISSSIVGSSGHPAADQAALAAARLGSSVPPAPASVNQRRFVITLITRVR